MPGYEAPTARTFGRSNRGAAIRVPSYVTDPELRRIEYRPPDLTCNPYLCAAAILMAGLDGVVNRIDPVAAGFHPEDAPSDASRQEDFLPRSLADALDALERDHQFLTRDGVFPEALIRRWLEIKHEEIQRHQPAAASLRVYDVFRLLDAATPAGTRDRRSAVPSSSGEDPWSRSACSTAARTDFVDVTAPRPGRRGPAGPETTAR